MRRVWTVRLLGLALSAPALAQETPRGADAPREPGARRTERRAERPQERDGRGTAEETGRAPRGRAPGANPFGPAREDFGPLQPGELERLLAFVQRRAPRIAAMLERVQTDQPEQFDERMHELTPQLRRLMRLFEENPQLAQRLLRHAENLEGAKRRARALGPGNDDAPQQKLAMQELRGIISENVKIEAEVLETRMQELQSRRDAIVEQEFQRLTGDPKAVRLAPAELRPLLEQYAAGASDAQRAALAADLRQRIGARLDEGVQRLRGHAAKLRNREAAEVNQRVDALREQAGGKPNRPDRPRRQPKPDAP